MAVDGQVLDGAVQTRLVGGLEDGWGVEGGAALDVSLAAVGTEGPQRHRARKASRSCMQAVVVQRGTWHG